MNCISGMNSSKKKIGEARKGDRSLGVIMGCFSITRLREGLRIRVGRGRRIGE